MRNTEKKFDLSDYMIAKNFICINKCPSSRKQVQCKIIATRKMTVHYNINFQKLT